MVLSAFTVASFIVLIMNHIKFLIRFKKKSLECVMNSSRNDVEENRFDINLLNL